MKLTRYRPIPSLNNGKSNAASAGRNNQGRITVRHRGGGHAKNLRSLDWSRSRGTGRIIGFSYDPRRSAPLATLLHTQSKSSGSKSAFSYIVANAGRSLFQEIRPTGVDSAGVFARPGDQVRLGNCEPGDFISAIEPHPNHGPRFARAAGAFAQVMVTSTGGSNGGMVTVRLPSGAQRNIPATSLATKGLIASKVPLTRVLSGKAGRTRWQGWRPSVRGVARNPVDHPHGGNTAGGRPSVTFKSWPTKGQPTRAPRRQSRFVLPKIKNS